MLPARRDLFFREFALPTPALQLDEHIGLLRRVEQVLADLVVRAGRVQLHNSKTRVVEQIGETQFIERLVALSVLRLDIGHKPLEVVSLACPVEEHVKLSAVSHWPRIAIRPPVGRNQPRAAAPKRNAPVPAISYLLGVADPPYPIHSLRIIFA
jgi:hypothetical protein